jgi:hypothetical protein
VEKGSSGVVRTAGADFPATFFAATFLTAAFLAVFLAAGFAVVSAAAFFVARLRAGGVSPVVPAGDGGMVSCSLLVLIRDRLKE